MRRDEEIVPVALGEAFPPRRMGLARIVCLGLALAQFQHKLKPLQKCGHGGSFADRESLPR